jgi:hypothetical protein
VLLAVAGCAVPVDEFEANSFAATSGLDKVAALEAAILALGPGVRRDEAAQVARISVEEPLVWAQQWGAVDAPLIHNIQVNSGTKPRGLCKDWADDLEARLRSLGMTSLSLHRAIANSDNLRIEHSTVILSARGAPMDRGIVLDPWRNGRGRLFFSTVAEDTKYRWIPRAEVFAMKRARDARRAKN